MYIIKDKTDWNNLIQDHFNEFCDIYFKNEYFELFSKIYDVEPEGLFWEDKNIKIFWTHLIRKINKISYINCDYKDIITPYGYGGPLICIKSKNQKGVQKSINNFMSNYKKYALENNYICEFIRFHPIFKNWKLFEKHFIVEYVNDVVAIDLTKNLESIKNNMSKTTRRYINKAQKEFDEISIVENPSRKEIQDFLSLYNETMKIQNASNKYYFSYDFINNHFEIGSLLVYCKNTEGLIGSNAIFLRGKYIMHYHLGSTNYNFRSSPLRAVLWKTITRAKEIGLKWFHFGGGRGKNDSLFDFKKGFSDQIFPFYTGKIIFNNKKYRELASLNPNSTKNQEFFPFYRKEFDDSII